MKKTGTVSTQEELYSYLVDAHEFALVKETGIGYKLFKKFLESLLLRYNAPPPYPLLHDIVAIVFFGDNVHFKTEETYPGEFARSYRVVLDTFLRYDNSVKKVIALVSAMNKKQQEIFLEFFLKILTEALSKFMPMGKCTIQISYNPEGMDFVEKEYKSVFSNKQPPLYANILQENLSAWILRVQEKMDGDLFDKNDLTLFHYYVFLRENNPYLENHHIYGFIDKLRTYAELMNTFDPYSKDVIRKARKIQEVLTPVKEDSIFSFGGYVGIRPSGNLDHAECLLPSELAYIEDDTDRPDIFDLHMAENRLQFFTRDQSFSLRKKRRFHIIFWEPQSMDYQFSLLPARWSFIFLSLVFQIIGLFRDVFSLKYYPFQFVFSGKDRDYSDIEILLELIAGRDYPDIQITNQAVSTSDMESYFEREITGPPGDHSCIIFAHDKWELNMMSVIDESDKQKEIDKFKAEPNKNKSTVLIIYVNTDNPKVWTIAIFNDEGELIDKELIDDVNNELAMELNKEECNKDRIIELATSYLDLVHIVALPEKYSKLHQIKVYYKGDDKDSKASISIQGNEQHLYEIINHDTVVDTHKQAMGKLGQLRDELTLQVIAGRLHSMK